MSEVVKSYKGFNKDMTCRGFQYEEGKKYEEINALVCENGFHACEYPLDCLGYYSPSESVYHEVEQSGKLSKESYDTKVASTKIKIGAKLSIAGLVEAAIEYTKERVKQEEDSDRKLWSILSDRIQRSILSDKRTATEIECELVVNGLLEEVRE